MVISEAHAAAVRGGLVGLLVLGGPASTTATTKAVANDDGEWWWWWVQLGGRSIMIRRGTFARLGANAPVHQPNKRVLLLVVAVIAGPGPRGGGVVVLDALPQAVVSLGGLEARHGVAAREGPRGDIAKGSRGRAPGRRWIHAASSFGVGSVGSVGD